MPLYLGASILGNSRRILEKFLSAIDGFKDDIVYYTDIDCLFIEKSFLKSARYKLLKKEMDQGKNYYGRGGSFYALFIASKVKYCMTTEEYGILDAGKFVKEVWDMDKLLVRKHYFGLLKGKSIGWKYPKN